MTSRTPTWGRPGGAPAGRRREPGPDELRLFVALPLPADAADRLREALIPLRERFSGPRWLMDETFHVTLLFLGPTLESRIGSVREAVDAAAARVPSFEARTAAGGGRTGQPRQGGLGVAWLNLDRGASEAARLAIDLGERLGTGVSWPAKGHAAHITVARRASGELVRALAEPDAVAPVTWHADRIVLFSSRLGSGGARYESVHVAPLTGEAEAHRA